MFAHFFCKLFGQYEMVPVKRMTSDTKYGVKYWTQACRCCGKW